jgi:predicted O-methyltransferase YrrM
VTKNDCFTHSELDPTPDVLCDTRPQWVTGSLSRADARFLFSTAVDARTSTVVEIGTASGFSTTVLCCALEAAARLGCIEQDFAVRSYDISSHFYADPSRAIGDAAREMLSAELLSHITFVNPATAVDVASDYRSDSLDFVFIDANHNHPWPALDLIAILDVLRPGARVVLHDINLPLIHPEFPAWGVKHLFDNSGAQTTVPADGEGRLPNVGQMIVPRDKVAFKRRLLEIVYAFDWNKHVSDEYLARVGVMTL